MRCRRISSAVLHCSLLLPLFTAAPLQASEPDEAKRDAESEPESDEESASEPAADASESKEEVDADSEEREAKRERRDRAADGAEAESKLWLGLRYRAVVVPKFMINWFAQGGTSVFAHSAGPELAIRNGLQEYNFGLWYAGYGMDRTPFKGKNEPVEAWEIVESQIKVLYLTSDAMWGQALSPKLSFIYGLGVGIGFVFGDLNRTQAYPTAGANNETGEGYKPCAHARDPVNPTFCGTDNDHYPPYSEPNWLGGGSKPFVFPWLALQTGLRYAFSPKFAGRFDVGFGTSGLFIGLGGDYGL